MTRPIIETDVRNVDRVAYCSSRAQKALVAGAALIAFTLQQIFRRDAYRQVCQHLPPSSERLACVSSVGNIAGLEGGMVALVTATIVYLLINRINRRTERPHQQEA
jgi:hypothetical protein